MYWYRCCSSEADYEDFESVEQDEIIYSDACSEENGKTLIVTIHVNASRGAVVRMCHFVPLLTQARLEASRALECWKWQLIIMRVNNNSECIIYRVLE